MFVLSFRLTGWLSTRGRFGPDQARPVRWSGWIPVRHPPLLRAASVRDTVQTGLERQIRMGSVVKKRRKRMAKKKHRKLLRKTRVQRRRLGK